jgi:crotonobetainyl-CoA:carnitine CoA-transferase CaiB-like acyl-CoA transferase
MNHGPMHGIKVIDLSIALTGPYAAALLADQGADVIKVERPGMGDIARWIGVSVNGVSALFHMCNRGKRGISIDLQHPEGQALLRRLVASADVFVQNFRPGVLDRLGLGYEALTADNPDLIYMSISGFGSTGPYAHKGAYDTVIQAYGGLAVNEADATTGDPRFLNQTAADKITAMYAVQALTAALFARERGLGGQHIDLSMLDAVASFLWADAAGNEVMTESDRSSKSSFSSGFAPFRFADGWGICTPTSDADFAGMCAAFGVSGPDVDEVSNIVVRHTSPDKTRAVMDRCYASAATMTTDEAIAVLEAHKVPCGRVLSPADLIDDPHAQAIGMFDLIDHPRAGVVRRPRHPAQFAATPAAIGGACPGLGEHTDEVLAELGLPAEEIARLRADQVVV